MRILIAPDKFKGSLTALEVCDAIEAGIRRVMPDAETIKVPMADGGDGTVQALVDATGGEFVFEEATGPLGEKVRARFGILGDGETAVIEMAEASGHKLVPPERLNPLVATTYGTGELILAAINRGVRKLIIGIGGSATNDGGAGCMQALGARLLDERGSELPPGGAALANLAKIDVSSLVTRHLSLDIVVACDVDNPLTGNRGASAVFGPQKGATPRMVKELDAALKRYAEITRRDLDKDVEHVPGAGAAGGLGAGLMAFLDAKLHRGVEIVMDAVHLKEKMQNTDLVITGEGRLDEQTAHWKAPMGVARTAAELRVPVVAVVGEAAEPFEHWRSGIGAYVQTRKPGMSLDEAMRNAAALVADGGEMAAGLAQMNLKAWQQAKLGYEEPVSQN